MSQGIMHYNRGQRCLVRLIVCIQSLRKHYKGNITLVQDGEHDTDLIKDLQKTFGIDVMYNMNPESCTMVRRIEICYKTSYDKTILLDTDTLVVGKVDEIFEGVSGYDFTLAHFAGWKSNGGTIRKRILRYKDAYPQYMDAAIAYGPAINCGMIAFPKNSIFLKEWHEVSKVGEKMHMFIPDEVACQILIPRYKVNILPLKFNVSVRHDPNTQDKRIIHLHGKKHVTPDSLCQLWIDAFQQACEENVCNIRKFADPKYGDKRLRKFLAGRYGRRDQATKIKSIIQQDVPKTVIKNIVPIAPKTDSKDYKLKENIQDVTIVTACDPKYVGHLQATYPNWVKYKKIDKFPMIVYINGFKNGIESKDLDFLKSNKNIKIIEWDFPPAQSQRERMLSCFVYGTARDVTTKYWIKVDADAFCTNYNDLLDEEMKDYDIYGHKWGYTKPGRWISELDVWANKMPVFNGTKPIFDPKNLNGNRYSHNRIASYIQFHKTEFVKKAAEIAGKRWPVPSHDTYLWYVAERLGRKWKRHNFKRYTGFSNSSRIEKLKRVMANVDEENKNHKV